MTESRGLRRVLELVGPSLRAQNASGSFTPGSYATPLTVASYVLEAPFALVVTATSTEAEQLRDGLVALLGWARVAVRDHTNAQVIGGSALGAAAALLAYAALAGSAPSPW